MCGKQYIINILKLYIILIWLSCISIYRFLTWKFYILYVTFQISATNQATASSRQIQTSTIKMPTHNLPSNKSHGATIQTIPIICDPLQAVNYNPHTYKHGEIWKSKSYEAPVPNRTNRLLCFAAFCLTTNMSAM